MKISVFRNKRGCDAQSLVNMDVNDLWERIRKETADQLISRYREDFDRLSAPDQWVHYDRLPIVCPTSEFRRKASGQHEWVRYNGISILTVVGLNNEIEVDNVKRYASLFPQTFCALKGCDGHSVTIWTLSTLPNGTLPKSKEDVESFCAQAYATSVQCYAPTLEYDLIIEEPSLDKHCLLTLDEKPYINPHPTPFILEQPEDGVKVLRAMNDPSSRLKRLGAGYESYVTLTEVFSATYSRARQAMNWKPADFPERSVAFIAEECAESGLPEEDVVSRLTGHFRTMTETEIRAVVRNAYSNHEDDTPMHLAMSKHQMVAFRLREFMDRRYEIRFNEVLQMTEFRERRSLNFLFRELGRRELNTIHHEACLEGIEPAFSEVDELVHSNYVQAFNPISHFINNLPKWDGEDHIGRLCDMVPNSNPHWRRLFGRWFLSMVAHWMRADTTHANATAPILIGNQGYRKSTFCRQLLPPELRQFFTDSIDFRSNTEAERCLSRFLLVNIDEFDQLTERQFAFIKHLFQKPVSNIRRMRSEAIGSQRRYASFIGTSNHQEVLRDPTGNRRYLCVEVTAPIHVEKPINYNQLYAQAKNLILAGERYWLDDEDEALLRQENGIFEVETPLEQLFLSSYAVTATDTAGGSWVRPTEIMEEFKKHCAFGRKADYNLVKLGKVLTKLNAKKRKGKLGTEYYLKKR